LPVGKLIGRQESRDRDHVVARGDQRLLGRSVRDDLAQSDVAQQGVTQALAALGVFGCATFSHEVIHRLGGTPPTYRSRFGAVRLAKITQIADPLAFFVTSPIGQRALELDDFERKTGR
jgi:hypothetical protein